MKRRTPLQRKGKERGSPIPAFRAWLRAQPCAVTGQRPAEACHFPRVKQHGDARNLLPLIHAIHLEQHRVGRTTFAAKYFGSLALAQQAADDYWDAFIAETGYREGV